MTPRLKILTVGLVLSLIYAISDYIVRNRDEKPVEVRREVKERPKTARVDVNRIKRLKEKSAKIKKSKERRQEIVPEDDFIPIPENIESMQGWGRNPFIVTKEKPLETPKETTSEIIQESSFSDLEELKIESVAKLGDKVFVIINGQRFRQGDLINNMKIELIESQKITFLMGKTRIIKDVGT
ncbi:MAG: hypothetical protein CMG57_03715 [Candidatus Marinimicrobia bacterium]|nr:hypothetical protein [Candidatus Neomarinimicrobiota bacterium]|tara:strand:+ start:845 stop:1393 length:549 start_codon:yes stop_codon:yes gene_type:complete